MNKLDYSNFDSTNADIAFSQTNGYNNPASEELARKQLSYPLKEIKTFLGNAIPVDGSDNVIQLSVNDGRVRYRATANGAFTNLPKIFSGTTEPSADVGEDGDIYIVYAE